MLQVNFCCLKQKFYCSTSINLNYYERYKILFSISFGMKRWSIRLIKLNALKSIRNDVTFF